LEPKSALTNLELFQWLRINFTSKIKKNGRQMLLNYLTFPKLKILTLSRRLLESNWLIFNTRNSALNPPKRSWLVDRREELLFSA
jgi:hypothetical protein